MRERERGKKENVKQVPAGIAEFATDGFSSPKRNQGARHIQEEKEKAGYGIPISRGAFSPWLNAAPQKGRNSETQRLSAHMGHTEETVGKWRRKRGTKRKGEKGGEGPLSISLWRKALLFFPFRVGRGRGGGC